MNILVTLAFILAFAAFVYAYLTHKKVKRILSVVDNPQSRTVTIDHTDGRITVLKEPYGATSGPETS